MKTQNEKLLEDLLGRAKNGLTMSFVEAAMIARLAASIEREFCAGLIEDEAATPCAPFARRVADMIRSRGAGK